LPNLLDATIGWFDHTRTKRVVIHGSAGVLTDNNKRNWTSPK
jgi:hypothetical protein